MLFKIKTILLLAIVCCLLLVFCKKKSTDTASGDTSCKAEFSTGIAPANEITALENYLTQNNIIATKHPRGFYYKINTLGTGDSITTPCSTVKVFYKGTLTNGQTFDETTSAARSFTLSGLIQGWQSGIPIIKRKGKIKLYLPPSLGYGSKGNSSIPANAILIFDIELVDFSQ